MTTEANLNYPFNYGPVWINKPKLIYLDQDGMLVQLSLTNEEIQSVIDVRNTEEVLAHAQEIEDGDDNAADELKPPRG